MANLMDAATFVNRFHTEMASCSYVPHHIYNVFSTHGSEHYYMARRAEFEHKYRVFNSVAKTLQPSHIVELGTCAGASGHAYLCGAPQAKFTGYDLFGTHDENVWNPLGIAKKLLATVSSNITLIKEDLRNLREIPKADMVVVDGAHDFYNAYSDLILAFTADPEYIWVDDYHGRDVAEAVGWAGMYRAYDWWQAIEYCDGGMLIRMRK